MNNVLIDSLKKISAENFLSEKIIICPSFNIGNQILENLAKSGFSWINFKTETINSLAVRIAETEIYKRNLKVISLMEVNFLMDKVEKSFLKSKSLTYRGLNSWLFYKHLRIHHHLLLLQFDYNIALSGLY